MIRSPLGGQARLAPLVHDCMPAPVVEPSEIATTIVHGGWTSSWPSLQSRGHYGDVAVLPSRGRSKTCLLHAPCDMLSSSDLTSSVIHTTIYYFNDAWSTCAKTLHTPHSPRACVPEFSTPHNTAVLLLLLLSTSTHHSTASQWHYCQINRFQPESLAAALTAALPEPNDDHAQNKLREQVHQHILVW